MIVGVVRNTVADAFGESFKPIVYFSYRDRPAARGEIHVRAVSGAETLLAAAVEHVVRELDPALPVYDVRTMTEHVEKNLFLQRIPARMFVVLGPLLLLLAGVGIYAVVWYAVSDGPLKSPCALPSARRVDGSCRRSQAIRSESSPPAPLPAGCSRPASLSILCREASPYRCSAACPRRCSLLPARPAGSRRSARRASLPQRRFASCDR